ncbi:MAG: tetratricopeptide repeat protein [Candidatus Eremiobacteraeota bacterium]|nr:tetratricopeptide repeat protein [Candidatus Eremiobacteraeota bacterium]
MKKDRVVLIVGLFIGIAIGILLSVIYIRLTKTKEQVALKTPLDKEEEEIRKVVEDANESYLFGIYDITDWRDFVESLNLRETADKKRIWKFLDKKSKNTISSWKWEDVIEINSKEIIVNCLNKILEKKDFYNKKAFANIELGRDAGELLKKGIKNLSKQEIIKFNRLLFEAIYPVEIARSNKLEYVYYSIAKQMAQKKDYKSALKYFKRAIEMNPQCILYLSERAEIYKVQTQPDELQADLEKLMELGDYQIDTVSSLAFIYSDKGMEKKAIEMLTKKTDSLPELKKDQPTDKREELYHSRAGAYYYLKEYDKAFRDLDKAIEINPKAIEIVADRATFNERLGRMDRAKADARLILTKFPPPETSIEYQAYGVAYRILGDYEKSIKHFDKSEEANPRNLVVIYEKAMAHLKFNNREAACKDLKRVIELNGPDKAEAEGLLRKLGDK